VIANENRCVYKREKDIDVSTNAKKKHISDMSVPSISACRGEDNKTRKPFGTAVFIVLLLWTGLLFDMTTVDCTNTVRNTQNLFKPTITCATLDSDAEKAIAFE